MDNGHNENKKQTIRDEFDSSCLIVGEFVIDFNDGKVRKPDGSSLTVSRKPLRLLEVLILNRDKALSNAKLHAIVSEEAETVDAATRQHIKKLREIFDDTNKKIIATEPRGYRLTLPVQAQPESLRGSSTHKRSLEAEPVSHFFYSPVLWSGLLILVAVFGYYFYQSGQPISKLEDEGLIVSNYRPLTYLKGLEVYPDISPDGKWMLFNFIETGSNNWRLYLKDMSSAELIPLSGEQESAQYPKWSLDGNFLSYTRFYKGECAFMVAEFDVERKVLHNQTQVKSCNPVSRSAQAMLWKNNEGMFYLEEESYSSPGVIYSYNFDSKRSWQTTTPLPTSKGDYFFQLSPSGKQIAVLRSKHDRGTEIWTYNTQNWESTLHDMVNISLFRVGWSQDDQHLIYKNDKNQIVKTHVVGGHKHVLASLSVPFNSPLVVEENPDVITAVTGAMYSSDIVRKTQSDKDITFEVSSSARDDLPTVSTDGKYLAWVSNRTGRYQIWMKKTGGAEEMLTALERQTEFSSLSISPDGTKIGGTADGSYFIYDLQKERLLWGDYPDTEFKGFQWRSNSREFYVNKHKDGHRVHLKVDANTNESEVFELFPDAYFAMESLDGRYIYSWNINTKLITRFDTHTQSSFSFAMKTDLARTNQWTMSKAGLYLVQQDGQVTRLVFIGHSSTEPKILDENFSSRSITVASHANWIIYTQAGTSNTDLMILE